MAPWGLASIRDDWLERVQLAYSTLVGKWCFPDASEAPRIECSFQHLKYSLHSVHFLKWVDWALVVNE